MTHQTMSFAETNLEAYQWQNRLLLIFVPTVGDTRFETQQHLLMDQAPAFDDRDLLLIFAVDEASSSTGLNVLWYEDVDALRATYGVPSDAFALFLIGKDGGVKNRFDRPVSADEIYALIDVMPMRMREMQTDGQ